MARRPRRTFAGPLVALLTLAAGWFVMRGPNNGRDGSSGAPSQARPPLAQLVGATMGGSWSVRLARPMDAEDAEALEASLQRELDRLDGQMSTWKPDSDLSRFNAHRGTDWHAVSADLAAVAAEAGRVSVETGGAFDVTVGPLVNLWGFGPTTRASAAATPRSGPASRVPTDDAITAAKARVGYQRLDVRQTPPALRKLDPDVYVDLSGIAQGYAADVAATRLDGAGVHDYLLDVCGEFRARGLGDGGKPWRVAVQAPLPDTLAALRGVNLPDGVALATSGDYRNFFDAPGDGRYSHHIDPRTGRPARNRLASVSVAHPSAATADALATALMVLGPEAAAAFAERTNLAALFVVRSDDGRSFETRVTPAFPLPASGENPPPAH